MFKSFSILMLGGAMGAGLFCAYVTHSPALCRGVVVADIQAQNAYINKLASVMPVEPQKDFLTAMTQGRN